MEDPMLWRNLSNEVSKGVNLAYNDQMRANRDAFIEIEIQFGTFSAPKENQKNGNFRSFVSATAFDRVMKYMRRMKVPKITEEIIEDYLDSQERKAYNKSTNEIVYYDKIKVWSSYVFFDPREKRMMTRISEDGKYFAEELNSRINISNEYIYKSASKTFNPKTIRTKNRTSFYIDQIGKLDLTQASETSIDNQDENNGGQKKSFDTTYEIELEMSEKDFTRNTLKIQRFCELIYSLIQDSEIPYTNSEKSTMYRYVSSLLHIQSGMLRYSLLPEARDLKIEDMVYGGIVGNKNTEYAVTHKADGIRRLMVFMPTEVWIFMPGLPDANLLYRGTKNTYLSGKIPYKFGFIFDGELLVKENRKDQSPSKYMYYIFDCLCENGKDIRGIKDYLKRIQYAHSFLGTKMSDPELDRVVDIRIKYSKHIPNVNQFFEVMTSMFEDQKMLPYHQDGFMFIPLHTEYNPYDDSVVHPASSAATAPAATAPAATAPIYSRCLTDAPDICKWKPKEMRSIDFLVEIRLSTPTDRKIILYTLDVDPKTNERRLRPFVGTESHPLNGRIDVHHPILQSLLNKTIVEFYWDETKNLLVPIRIRTDKVSPNRYFSALNIWKGIFSGIEPDTLRGQTFQLMRAYHNQIKLNLYQNVSPTRNHKVLLDIGSGRGGDIKKWSDYELVFAVEPNESHLKELYQRLENSPMKHKVIIIPTGGEDYDTITRTIQDRYGERVSNVSLMLSLSFFFGKYREGLRKTIEQTLETGGEVLIFTIDGDTVKNVFEESCKDCLHFLNAETKYEPSSGKLWIDIPSTIVSKQEEVPPKLSELFEKWDNFLPMNMSVANQEEMLNPEEKKFSNLFSSFKMIFLADHQTDEEKEEIVPYETFDNKEWMGVRISPYTRHFLLAAVLQAIDPIYQNNRNIVFRRKYEEQIWKEINLGMKEQVEEQQVEAEQGVAETLANYYDLEILYLSENDEDQTYGKGSKKIIINGNYLMAMKTSNGLQTIF